MAGFQQAANAIVGAPGQIMRATGIYNELVGKNEELIKELGGKNEELEKKNKELGKKNKEITNKNEELNLMNSNLISSLKLNLKQNELTQNIAKRLYSNRRARASRDLMIDAVYGEKSTGDTDRDLAKKELKREREKLNGGGK